jgi:hypothetical protein
VRDNFSQQTAREIAKGVGYRCSNPECGRATVAANEAQNETITVGDAAHICAAAPGGPRYDASQTPAERKGKANGIWLCKICARLVDVDPAKYSVETLREWKCTAQKRALHEVLHPRQPALTAEVSRIEALIGAENLAVSTPALADVFTRAHAAAKADLDAYHRLPIWSQGAPELTLRLDGDTSVPTFNIGELPLAVEMAPEVTIIAPAGTGKTTTVLQLASHVLARNAIIPLFFRLGDWSTGSSGLLASARERHAFRAMTKDELDLLAERGRLLLLLDGWNEIDENGRKRLRVELDRIRGEFPDVRVVVTTRRQMLDVPISGPRIAIERLSEDQQMEIARTGFGGAGQKAVDSAWRDAGLRELITTPLYLNALLGSAPGGAIPTTREELLRAFVHQHERVADHAEALRSISAGRHAEILTALATAATDADVTALTDEMARATIAAALTSLRDTGQILASPEPLAILDTLVSHHTLLRAGSGNSPISFQHQQFLEWYASFEVVRLMRLSAVGDALARGRLRVDVLDKPAWEEAVLFAVERLSRENDGSTIVADAIRFALPIDPMLAAEMIYRSSPTVWDRLKIEIMAFVNRWHLPGTEDRAVRFMIMTGRPEFEPLVWPLVSSEDSQIQLPALRTAPRFRPAVLGEDIGKKVAALSEETREHFLALIASESGIDGMDLATDLAIADPSPKIQAEVVQYLQFRRADRHVARLLKGAHDETWAIVARRGYAEEIQDQESAVRLRKERDKLIDESSNLLEKVGLLVEMPADYPRRDDRIVEAIADPGLPVNGPNGGSWLFQTNKLAPSALLRGIQRRLELGLPLPFHAFDLFDQIPMVDDGPIADMILDVSKDNHEANRASVVAGPKTTAALLDQYLALAQTLKQDRNNPDGWKVHSRLRARLSGAHDGVFIDAIVARADTDDPELISDLASLVTTHGDSDDQKSPPRIDPQLRETIVRILRSWCDAVLSSTNGNRNHMHNVANAIGRFAYPELLADLKRLLDEDLTRHKTAREGFVDAQRRIDTMATSDARMSYSNWYQRDFSLIGGDEVVGIMTGYLEEPMFAVEASLVLKAISDRKSNVPDPTPFDRGTRFEAVAVARAARAARREPRQTNAIEEAIFGAVGRLARKDDRESQLLAIKLGSIGLSVPHVNRDKEIAALMLLPQPMTAKRELLAAMALDGQILDSAPVLQAIDAWIADAGKDETTAWHKRQNTWEIEPWLELLPFTDRPESVIDGLTKVKAFYGTGHRPHFERVLAAVANVRGYEGEILLRALAIAHRDIASDHSWTQDILRRDTASATLLCADLVIEGRIGADLHSSDAWSLARQLTPYVEKFPELRPAILDRYKANASGRGRATLEHLIGEAGDSTDFIEMVKTYVAEGRGFDGRMQRALREVTLWNDPVPGGGNAYYVRPSSVADLRRFLFWLLTGTAQEAALASRCLTSIDELRDEHGIAAGDPRHPDIATNRPWPVEAAYSLPKAIQR